MNDVHADFFWLIPLIPGVIPKKGHHVKERSTGDDNQHLVDAHVYNVCKDYNMHIDHGPVENSPIPISGDFNF